MYIAEYKRNGKYYEEEREYESTAKLYFEQMKNMVSFFKIYKVNSGERILILDALDEILKPFYKEIKSIEKDCGFPIQSLHVDLILDAFKKTVQLEFEQYFKEKRVNDVIEELIEISKKWLGSHLVCQLMLMMDTWENNDELYENEFLKQY